MFVFSCLIFYHCIGEAGKSTCGSWDKGGGRHISRITHKFDYGDCQNLFMNLNRNSESILSFQPPPGTAARTGPAAGRPAGSARTAATAASSSASAGAAGPARLVVRKQGGMEEGLSRGGVPRGKKKVSKWKTERDMTHDP